MGAFSVPPILSASAQAAGLTTTGSGSAIVLKVKSFALQVRENGTVTAWDVRIEGTLDGTNWYQILQHTAADLSGTVKWTGAALYPVSQFRYRVAGLTLGAGTSIDVFFLGTA